MVSSGSTLPPTALAGPSIAAVQLGRGHRPEADLAVLDGSAQRVVGLDVGVEIGAGAEDQGAGCRGGGVQHEVDEQARVGGVGLVVLGLDLAFLGLGVELFPLVDIEEEAGGAGVVLQAVADELGERHLALAQEVGAGVDQRQLLGAGEVRLGRVEGLDQRVQGLGTGAEVEDLPDRLLAGALLLAQRREQAGEDDRRLAAAGAAEDGDDVGRRALADLGDQLVDEALAAEEQAGVLLAERQQAAIGAQASEVAGEAVDGPALRGGEQALQGLGLVEAGAQVDPGVQVQEGAERDVVGLQVRQQDGDDRERARGLLGIGLPDEPELDLAMLPAADAGGAEQDDQGAAMASAVSSSGCQGLPPGRE